MQPDERYAHGREVSESIWGEPYMARVCERLRAIYPDFERLMVEFALGDVWGRPGLDRRTRSLCNVAALIADGRPNHLRLHVHGALANGASTEEIFEVCLQMAVYAGFPAAWDGLTIAAAAIREWQEDPSALP